MCLLPTAWKPHGRPWDHQDSSWITGSAEAWAGGRGTTALGGREGDLLSWGCLWGHVLSWGVSVGSSSGMGMSVGSRSDWGYHGVMLMGMLLAGRMQDH